VRIADRAFLDKFRDSWKYPSQAPAEQLGFADRVTIVKVSAFTMAAIRPMR